MQLLLFIAFYINQPIKTKDMTQENAWGGKTSTTVAEPLIGLIKQSPTPFEWEKKKLSLRLINYLTTVLFSMKALCDRQRVVSIEFIKLYIPIWSRRLELQCQFCHHCHKRQQSAWAKAIVGVFNAQQEIQTGIQVHQMHRNETSRHNHF